MKFHNKIQIAKKKNNDPAILLRTGHVPRVSRRYICYELVSRLVS